MRIVKLLCLKFAHYSCIPRAARAVDDLTTTESLIWLKKLQFSTGNFLKVKLRLILGEKLLAK
jgi:hypothetical protein